MFSTPHLSVPVPQSGVKLVSSDSRHLASLKKGGPERGRFFCFSRSCTLAIRDEIRKNRLFPHSPLTGCLPSSETAACRKASQGTRRSPPRYQGTGVSSGLV